MEDQLPHIVALLQDKAILKQGVYRATLAVFEQMKILSSAMADVLSKHFASLDPSVEVVYNDEGTFEFHLKFSGDLLMFQMQTNVHSFGPEHLISKSPYVAQDDRRGYFGSITVYNFMADSLKYGRLNDAGYLLGRILLNHEMHYYIEGIRQLNFLHPDIAQNKITPEILRDFIQGTMILAIETDLVAPSFPEIQVMALGAKLQDQMAGAAKVGFQIKGHAHEQSPTVSNVDQSSNAERI